jgi:hypothetical protein
LTFVIFERSSQLFNCNVRKTRTTGLLGMTHSTTGLYKIPVPPVNCRPTGRFHAILSAEICQVIRLSMLFLTLQWNSLGRTSFDVHASQRDVRLRKIVVALNHDCRSETRCGLLHYDSSKHCTCPLNRFI